MLLANLSAARGSQNALNVAVDGKLTSRQRSHHDNPSTKAEVQTTKAKLLGHGNEA